MDANTTIAQLNAHAVFATPAAFVAAVRNHITEYTTPRVCTAIVKGIPQPAPWVKAASMVTFASSWGVYVATIQAWSAQTPEHMEAYESACQLLCERARDIAARGFLTYQLLQEFVKEHQPRPATSLRLQHEQLNKELVFKRVEQGVDEAPAVVYVSDGNCDDESILVDTEQSSEPLGYPTVGTVQHASLQGVIGIAQLNPDRQNVSYDDKMTDECQAALENLKINGNNGAPRQGSLFEEG